MFRRDVLAAGAIAGATAIAGCLSNQLDTPGFYDGFESGLGDWTPGAAIGPEVDLVDFEWVVDVTDAEAAVGERSLRIWNEGDYDDGVTWAAHPVPVTPGQAYRITVTAQFWSPSESFNTIRDAVLYLGPATPTEEADFPASGVNTTDRGETPQGGLREPLWLAEGWREYRFEWTTPELATDQLVAAVGTTVVWEADATHYVDDVAVEFEPR